MATDFWAIGIGAGVIGMMDRPTGEPQDLALQSVKRGKIVRRDHASHRHTITEASARAPALERDRNIRLGSADQQDPHQSEGAPQSSTCILMTRWLKSR